MQQQMHDQGGWRYKTSKQNKTNKILNGILTKVKIKMNKIYFIFQYFRKIVSDFGL